jgi:trimethylamine:corrinoid methyltransferase-like protein
MNDDLFYPYAIHNNAIKILKHIGVLVPNPATRKKLAGNPGIEIKNERVYFQEYLIDSYVQEIRRNQISDPFPDKFRGLYSGSLCQWIVDFDNKIRPFTSEDMINELKLIKQCEKLGVSSSCPGSPMDQHPVLRTIIQAKTAMEFLNKPMVPNVGDPKVAEYILEMTSLFGKNQWTMSLHPISPLRMEGDEWDWAVSWIDRIRQGDVESRYYISNMPAIGISSPCDPLSAWSQSVAEVLGGAIILRLLGVPVVDICPKLYPSDFKYGNWVYGSPEHSIITLQEWDIRNFYGLASINAKSFTTTSPSPNSQAAADKMLHSVLAALKGYRKFSGAGVLGNDIVWSPAQLMIDLDIYGEIQHICRKDFQMNGVDCLAAVSQGVRENSYIASDDTLNNYQKLFYQPIIFDRINIGQWLTNNHADIIKRASDAAKNMIVNYRADSNVSSHKIKELDKIFECAKKQLIK